MRADPLLRQMLAEDRAAHDITSRSILPAHLRIHATVVARQGGVVAGLPVAQRLCRLTDRRLRCRLLVREGAAVRGGQRLLRMEGSARSVFAVERSVLNLIGHLSGIATLTQAFVRHVRGTKAGVYDTRKTLPGLRALEKYAVRVGGGRNHRMDLASAILVKTNHLMALGQGSRIKDQGNIVQQAIKATRQKYPKKSIEIEVHNWSEFQAALTAKPHTILLDNWSLSDIKKAVRARHPSPVTRHPSPVLEVSGGVTLANIRAIAKTGVDRISVGALTHSAPFFDVALEA